MFLALLTVLGVDSVLAQAPTPASRRSTLRALESEPAEGQVAPTDEELASLRQAVDDDPKNRQARFELVRGLMRAEAFPKALEAAREWRAKDAYNLVVVRLLGDIYTELGDTSAALRAYSAVVELLPKDARAQRALASVLKQGGNLSAAYERLSAAAHLHPDDTRIAFELADVAQRMGRLDDARSRFEEIVTSSESSMAVRYPASQRLAQIYAGMRRRAKESGDAQDAEDLARKIAELNIQGGVENDIKIYLTWDTDRSDVDLWVTNPAREKVFYSHKVGRFGGALYGDVTTGYGPESFTAKSAARGTYRVEVHYYSAGASNFPEARGEVIVVLDEGKATEERHVLPYRLFRQGQTVTVADIEIR